MHFCFLSHELKTLVLHHQQPNIFRSCSIIMSDTKTRISSSLPRERKRKRNLALPGVPATRPPSSPKFCEKNLTESSSGTSEGDSDSSVSILSQGSTADDPEHFIGLPTRLLYRKLARADGLAQYHYAQYREQTAKRNTIRQVLKQPTSRRQAASNEDGNRSE